MMPFSVCNKDPTAECKIGVSAHDHGVGDFELLPWGGARIELAGNIFAVQIN